MKPATKEESLRAIKAMLERRCKKKGFFAYTDKWLTETAEKILAETPQGVQVLEPEAPPSEGEKG